MDITANTTIGELLKVYPAALEVLEQFHLECLDCKGSRAETLRLGALSHGVDPEELVRELREFIQKREARSGGGS
ncbi:MAG: DUF1858 domain-containing protein [Nitrospinota bacterium]